MTGARLIRQLEELLAKDPTNVKLLAKLGDAHWKEGDMTQAAEYYARVAEQYARDGYFLKAVALLKQSLKVDPSHNALNLRLAELHSQLQLHGEALAYLAIYLPAATKQRDIQGCLCAARLRVQLSDKPDFRLYLVQLLLTTEARDEAAKELLLAAQALDASHPDLAATARCIDLTVGADTGLEQLVGLRAELNHRTTIDQALLSVDPSQRN